MTDMLDRLTHALLDAARKAGAEAADAMAIDGRSTSIDIRAGALEQAERAEAVEIGLRVLIGGRQACVSASDISDATVAALAERASPSNSENSPKTSPAPTSFKLTRRPSSSLIKTSTRPESTTYISPPASPR